jgi:hypothetical protein
MVATLRKYRKGVLAVLGAVVTVANISGLPLAEDLPDAVIAVYDSVIAALVIVVPNDQ